MATKTDLSLKWLLKLKEDDNSANTGGDSGGNAAPASGSDNGTGDANAKPADNGGGDKPAEGNNGDQKQGGDQQQQGGEQIDPAMIKELNTTMKSVLDALKQYGDMAKNQQQQSGGQQQAGGQAPAAGQQSQGNGSFNPNP